MHLPSSHSWALRQAKRHVKQVALWNQVFLWSTRSILESKYAMHSQSCKNCKFGMVLDGFGACVSRFENSLQRDYPCQSSFIRLWPHVCVCIQRCSNPTIPTDVPMPNQPDDLLWASGWLIGVALVLCICQQSKVQDLRQWGSLFSCFFIKWGIFHIALWPGNRGSGCQALRLLTSLWGGEDLGCAHSSPDLDTEILTKVRQVVFASICFWICFVTAPLIFIIWRKEGRHVHWNFA